MINSLTAWLTPKENVLQLLEDTKISFFSHSGENKFIVQSCSSYENLSDITFGLQKSDTIFFKQFS